MQYANGYGVELNLETAAGWYQQSADQGYEPAQVALGLMCLAGQGVPQDTAKAAVLLRSSADNGNARARYDLGLLTLRGDGVPQNRDKAETLLRASARQGHAPAMVALARLHGAEQGDAGNPQEAALWYRAAAEAGDVGAQFMLGTLYARGDGVPMFIPEAVKWFEKAAEQGHAAAQFNYATFLSNGTGVPRATRRPRPSRYEKAAGQQGMSGAQVRLAALMINDPSGTFGDPARAAELLTRAADADDVDGVASLGQLYLHGRGVEQDRDRAEALFRRAADRGHAPALVQLGQILSARSEAVEAARCFQNAAESGDPRGACSLLGGVQVYRRWRGGRRATTRWRRCGSARRPSRVTPAPNSGLARCTASAKGCAAIS